MNAHLMTIYDKPPPSRTRVAWWRFVERQLPTLVIYLLVATLVGVVLAPVTLVTVPSGYVGVLWKRFGGGTVLDPRKLKDEGIGLSCRWSPSIYLDVDSLPRLFWHIDISLGYDGRGHCNPELD
jgi:hypothetical protein